MATEVYADVPKIKIVGSRLDAEVIVGVTKVNVTIDLGRASVYEAFEPLRKVIIEAAKGDLAAWLSDLFETPPKP